MYTWDFNRAAYGDLLMFGASSGPYRNCSVLDLSMTF